MTAPGPDTSKVVELVGRRAVVTRQTKETSVTVSVDLDGTGRVSLATGIGFALILLGSVLATAPSSPPRSHRKASVLDQIPL